MDVLLFGDQSPSEIASYLHGILFDQPKSPLVACFLNAAGCRLRDVIAELPALQRRKVPPFATLEEFLARYTSGKDELNPVVEATFQCLVQLADYLSFSENETESTEEVAAIGLSTGLIPAITASFIPKGLAGVKVAVYAVELAFRLALYIDEVSDRLQTTKPGVDRSFWAIHAKGLNSDDAESAIKKALGTEEAESQSTPLHNIPYISAIWPSGTTISGPPLMLEWLQDRWNVENTVSTVPARVLGPYHAPHLISTAEALDEILDEAALQEFEGLVPSNLHVLSIQTGEAYNASSLPELYRLVITEIISECQNVSAFLERHQLGGRLFAMGPIDQQSPLVVAIKGRNSILEWTRPVASGPEPGLESKKERIAIVGMSGRFPGAQNLDEFWKVLFDGMDMHKEVPSDRFDAEKHVDPSGKGKNKSHTPFGCFVDNAGLFDPRFFNMSPREATQTDPMQRLSLLTAYEALEMSGYVPNRTPSTQLDRIGTFYGQTSDDWREINEAQDIDTYFITGGVRAFGPGRINYHFGFSGPSLSIDTACSSSMAAIHTACNALWLRDCDTAITGGVNIMTNPDIFAGLSKGQFLSKTGPCQTFDNDADGYCRGDAVASLILKRLSDAEADNDNILGVILSAATNHSADAISITHPHAGTQEILYRRVLNQAAVNPKDISYVEMHGTGTQAGDDTEMRSVSTVFAPAVSPRRPDQKLYVGSVKANVGHGEASSGVTAIVKVLLMMRHNMIPPHVGIKGEINRGFPDLAARNAHIARQAVELPRPKTHSRKIFINNFSAAGGNTAIVMEEGFKRQIKGTDPRPTHVIAVSACALGSLKKNVNNLISYLDANPNVSLASLSYTTTARRIQYSYRYSVAASDISGLKASLARVADSNLLPVPKPPKVAFTFTGQGSMYPGVAADLFKTSTLYRKSMLEFDALATSFGFPSIVSIADGTEEQSTVTLDPVMVQVAQVCIQMAITRFWKSLGITPDVVVGHSLGEYAALFAAGVLSASDTIFLVGSRAQLLVARCTAGSHAMLAVQGDAAFVKRIIPENVEVACINSSNEIVLSGLVADIEAAGGLLEGQRMRVTKLSVPYAFHSSQVEPILETFAQIASSVAFRAPNCEYLSPLLGRPLEQSTIDANYLCRHAREAVNFGQAVGAAKLSHVIDDETVFLEIGPHPVSTNFVKATLGSSIPTCHSLNRKSGAWESMATALTVLNNKGLNVNWGEYHREFEGALELLELPSYGWALANYWIDYKGDWCLTKGQSLISACSSPLKTTSVQRVVEEKFSDKSCMLVAESDLSRPDLKEVLHGHMVNGVALCPSTLYGDMGITIGEYMYRRMFPGSAEADIPRMNVCKMEVGKTLIFRGAESQVIKISAEASKSKETIGITISSVEGQHATFSVEFGTSAAWLEEWKRTGYLVDARIRMLRDEEDEDIHTLNRKMAYKLFGSFVEYEKPFQGMKKVYLKPDEFEATADIVLQTYNSEQNFVVPPYWIDSVGHLSGFVVNCQTAPGSEKNVYVSHGWDSLRLARTLMPGGTYRTYVRMAPVEGTPNMVSGDVYCLEGTEVIALYGGVKFMRIPRNVLDQVLPRPRSGTALAAAPVAAVADAPKKDSRPSFIAIPTAAPRINVTSLTSKVMAIIAEEVGVDESELADPNGFADLGVDSLMQLSINSRMREDLELDIPSSLFIDNPTVGDLKVWLRGLEPDTADTQDTQTTASTYISNLKDDSSTDNSQPSSTPLSHDSGVHILASDISEYKTGKVAESVDGAPVVQPLEAEPLLPNKRATSMLLQGNIKTATTLFFMFPDGGGAAASYAPIPALSPDIAVFGLNSPFMTTPEEYTCGVSGVARYYVEEMKRRQPVGPYNVGGWSAGGVIAFEGAQQLIRAGDKVDRLILIDSPCPLTIEPLPISLHRWFNTLGLLGDGEPSKIPSWLLPHFQASINALSTYHARSIDPAKAPTTYIIWCEDGVCKNPEDPRPDPYPYGHAQFLLENKTDLGPQLWDAMVGRDNLRISHIPGNHFTMMRAPFVANLGDKIRDAFN
ncbi:conidial yellow pigment biosynthesis polyketide synthase [Penicillium taxi]|uniref:conidial yellow pigment biosynthesis polyketide synthase n=1 Tax=Penicillium taxi TaxID=168475 RepID=UPI0025452A91|nr:conidial yellow pigment biosynthesis polyketide synthase [Penicillium taxi]KAJ5884708.1 conidial yellow pigment biosynthesis polyketide synthase [Penicillium taxi]